jgi:hypothetical protein
MKSSKETKKKEWFMKLYCSLLIGIGSIFLRDIKYIGNDVSKIMWLGVGGTAMLVLGIGLFVNKFALLEG